VINSGRENGKSWVTINELAVQDINHPLQGKTNFSKYQLEK